MFRRRARGLQAGMDWGRPGITKGLTSPRGLCCGPTGLRAGSADNHPASRGTGGGHEHLALLLSLGQLLALLGLQEALELVLGPAVELAPGLPRRREVRVVIPEVHHHHPAAARERAP